MADISLQPGDALRIESGSGLVLLVRRDGRAWEIQVVARRDYAGRLGRALLGGWRRWVEAWREEKDARRLAQLDERTLRDIGLDPGSGSPLAARAHAYRQQELRRIAMAQLGLI